ncbi:MAG: hypothetical protein HYS27_22250 [Deltaproteobacteria bacterium]|nr:hypothetical protein [Deltaproteobacteria bacterium]
MRALPLLVFLPLLGCARSPPPLVEAPGARAVLAGASAADAVRWARSLGVTLPAGAERFTEGAPWAASVLPGGELVIVVLPRTALPLDLDGDALGAPVLGRVRAYQTTDGGGLLRAEPGRVLLAPDVAAARRTELAAILEVMATGERPTVLPPPPDGVVRVRVADELVPLGEVELRFERPSAGELRIAARAPGARADVVLALTRAQPPWACALDEGALAVMAVPPLGAATLDDAFDGPMLLALYRRGTASTGEGELLPGAALVVAGVPRAGTAEAQLAALVQAGAHEERAGARRTAATGGVSVVADDGLLAIGFGAAAPMSRISPQVSCPPAERPLAAGDLAAVARAAPGLLPAQLKVVPSAPMVVRAAPDGAGLALELRASLPAGVPF